MNMKRKILSLLLCAAVALSLLPVQVLAAEEAVSVTIFTTNDIHGVVEGSGAIGLVQAAAIKASTPNALLVDAGDATQGASFATISQGEDVIRLMNAAGYDVMAAGNHEFDYGAQRLLANREAASFPILSANVKRNGQPLLPGSAVVEVGGKSIAFIGLTTTNTATSTNPTQLADVTFGDEIAAAKKQIGVLSGEADAIVLICHMGNDEIAVGCTSVGLLDSLSDAELSQVTAVVDGHSHTIEQEIYQRGEISVPIVQTGTQFTALGRVELTFNGETVTAQASLLDYETAMAYPITEQGKAAAARVQEALDTAKASQADTLNQVLATSDNPLWGGYVYWDYAEPRIVETSYGDFVTDAFAESAMEFAALHGIDLPVVAVENGGGISATLPMGQVIRGDVLSAFNHGNMVEVIRVSPAQLYAALENGLTATGQDETGLLLRESVSGSFLQVSGFTYAYDPAAPAGAKVTSVELNSGAALDRNDTQPSLLLASNNYVTSFAAFAGAEKLGELGGEDWIVEEYILAQTNHATLPLNIPVSAGRIRIANDRSPAQYTVLVPVLSAEDKETALPGQMVHLSVDAGAYSEFVTDESGSISVSLTRGPHTLRLEEAADSQPVYVNNYSGSGTVTTREGYYRLGFLVEGTKRELPSDETANRAEALAALWSAAGEPIVNYLMTYSDVPQELWYGEAVRWASSTGVASGYGDGLFGPDDPISREQLAVMLYHIEQSQGGGFTGAWMFRLDYPDAGNISDWAYEALCWCTMNGILEAGSDGLLAPKAPVTRTQLAQILGNASGRTD